MFTRTTFRPTAALVSGILIAGSLAFAAPALASEPDEPIATAAADGAADTVTLTGYVTSVSDVEPTGSVRLFRVVGSGYLLVDFGDQGVASPATPVTVKLGVPAGVGTDFADLAAASLDSPLVAAAPAVAARETAALINQTTTVAAEHKIYAVLMTPANIAGTAPDASQTAAKVQNVVNYVDDFWSDQTAGKVTFDLVGTTTWSRSSFTCAKANADSLWAEAAVKATTQLGYKDSLNTHLAVFFPSSITSQCDGAIGLGTVGFTPNAGGLLWSVGTDSNDSKTTLAHELGHNLSYGHANWLDCTAANPVIGFNSTSPAGCTTKPYGDIIDVMGYGWSNKTAGSLSSPNAIRSGIWETGSFSNALQGTSSHTLLPIGGATGKRAVVVEDSNGYNYFIEFRNFTGHDAQYSGVSGGCTAATTYCIATQPGIRIFRLEQQTFGSVSYKGIAGDETQLIGRTVGGVKRINYVAGESFSTSTGLSISVSSLSATSATVSVTRPANTVSSSGVDILQATSYDSKLRVGDNLHATLSAYWEADSYSFQWLRNGKKISGATKQNYTLAGSDKGKLIAVKVTGKSAVGGTKYFEDPGYPYTGYGPVLGGVMQQGTAFVDAETFHPAFAAVPGGWTVGASFKYQWYRSATATSTLSAIKGATKQKYTPTSSDSGRFLTVKITGSKSGFGSKSTFSTRKNYTVTSAGSVAVTGTAKVGVALGLTNNAVFTRQDSGTTIVSPVLRYQWLANGAAISGATSTTFIPTSAQYNKAISVRITGSALGYASASVTSPAIAKTVKGTIAGGGSTAITSKSFTSAGIVLTASAPGVTEPGVKYAYKWYRNGVAIKSATKSTYKLTSSDYAKDVVAKITITKSNYTTVVLTTTLGAYSVIPSTPLPVLTGNPAIGQTLGVVSSRTYSNGGVPSYQWLRDGKAIGGATAATYLTTATDKGKAISVRVVASNPGYLSSTTTSAKTEKLGTWFQQGWSNPASFLMSDTATLTLTATQGVTEAGVTASYQWYRGSSAISKATKSTYKLTSADRGKEIKVRVVTKKTNFTPVTAFSNARNYSVMATSPFKPSIDDTTPIIDQTLTAIAPGYSQAVTHNYQWFVSGKAVSGATGIQFIVPSSAKGKTITVRIIATKVGYLSNTTTSPATSKVAAS